MSTVNSVAMYEAQFTHKSFSNQAITNLNAKSVRGNLSFSSELSYNPNPNLE